MKTIILITAITLISFSLYSQKTDKKEIKTFTFTGSELNGNKNSLMTSNIESLNIKNIKTKISPRDNFLPELSSSVDDI